MVLLVTPALEGLRAEWREAATGLGASTSQYIRHVAAPVLAPAVIGAVLLLAAERAGLYTIAATALGLIFMGIRNAWDVVTYVAIIDPRSDEEPNQDT